MLLLFYHISHHIYDYYFFLALNDLDGPYIHNCSICSIVHSVCIGKPKCIPPYWPYMYRPHDNASLGNYELMAWDKHCLYRPIIDHFHDYMICSGLVQPGRMQSDKSYPRTVILHIIPCPHSEMFSMWDISSIFRDAVWHRVIILHWVGSYIYIFDLSIKPYSYHLRSEHELVIIPFFTVVCNYSFMP